MAGRIPLTLAMGDGRALAFEVEAKREEPACFALGVRKSGSSVFSSIVSAMARFNGVNVVDIPGTMFEHGYRYADWNDPRAADLLWRGNCYIGFRDAPTRFYGDPVFKEAKKVLVVRDPRDALVSEYYSNAYSHRLPGAATGSTVIEEEREKALRAGLEDYVLKRAAFLDRTVAGYKALLNDPKVLVLRYEDVIFDKAGWMRSAAGHFGWRVTDQLLDHIMSWADVRPAAEDPKAFVRRVAPGDHRDKLSTAAIARIDGQLSDVWRRLGYGVGS